MFSIFVTVLVALAFLIFSIFKILREYERAVVFTLGRFSRVSGPGLVIVIPGIQTYERVNLRTFTLDVPPQDIISKDNVSIHVNAVVYYRVIDAQRSIIQIEDYTEATGQMAQTILRSILGRHELDEILSERETLNNLLQEQLDKMTDAWGIKISSVEIKNVDIGKSMIRAIARQAEAERERRAKIIHAQGELQASQQLVEASKKLSEDPSAMQLRYLQTLTEISSEQNQKVIIFPLPLELIKPLLHKSKPGDNT